MLSIVVPVGGKARRFYEAGYTEYKPFLPVGNRPMIRTVMENVRPSCPHRFVFVVRPEDLQRFRDEIAGPEDVVMADTAQKGAAYGVLLSKSYVWGDSPVMVVNSDQLVDWSPDLFLAAASPHAGCILTFGSDDSKWSYAVTNQSGQVEYVEEKPELPMGEATVGIYYWRRGSDMVTAMERMMEDGFRVNGEFYVCPSYNWMPRHLSVVTHRIADGAMHGLGTPEDYERYVQSHPL